MNKIVAIGGQLASGKDTLADYLNQTLGWNRIAFADAVKKVFMDAFGEDRAFIEKWKREESSPPGYSKNVRKALQFIGDGFRTIRPEIWIEILFRQPGDKIISDARYLNEVEYAKKLGAVSILIWRPGFENNDPNLSESQIRPLVDYYASIGIEGPIMPGTNPPQGADLFDLFIVNNGTKEELYEKADKMILPYIKTHYRLLGD